MFFRLVTSVGQVDVLIAVAINIRNKVLFNIEYFKNFLPFSSIPFTISGAQFKEAGYSKIYNC